MGEEQGTGIKRYKKAMEHFSLTLHSPSGTLAAHGRLYILIAIEGIAVSGPDHIFHNAEGKGGMYPESARMAPSSIVKHHF